MKKLLLFLLILMLPTLNFALIIDNGGGAGGPGSDTTAIHIDTADEFDTAPLEGSPNNSDKLLIESNGNSDEKRYITIGTLPTGTGMTSFDVSANAGSVQTISSGNTLVLLGNNGLTSTASATDTVTFGLDSTTSTNIGTALTHVSNNGSDHSYIDQDVTSGTAPTFTADNFSDGGSNAIITTTQETNFETAYTHANGSTGADHTYIDQSVVSGATPTFTATNFSGASGITGLGTVATGIWQGTAIADTYVANDLTISGGTVNNTPIGASSANTAEFTSVTVNSITDSTATITGGDISGVGTITATTVNGTTLTDGTISITGGNLTGATGVTATNLTGTLQTGSQTNITAVGTIVTGVWSGTSIVDAKVDNDLTIAGGTIGTTAITLVNSAGASPTTLAVIQYDSTGDFIVVGDGTNTRKFSDIQTEYFACSDEDTDLTTGTAKLTFHSPNFDIKLTDISASLKVAPVGATLNVDVNDDGSSIFSTVLTIDPSELTSETATDAHVFSSTVVSANSKITIDIDQIGSSTAGDGLKVRWYYRRN